MTFSPLIILQLSMTMKIKNKLKTQSTFRTFLAVVERNIRHAMVYTKTPNIRFFQWHVRIFQVAQASVNLVH